MFETAKTAGLRPSDISKLLGVHRVTVSLWFNGHKQPHHFLTDKVNRLLGAIDRAVDAGALPVPADKTGEERAAYLRTVVHRHLAANLQPA